jgi:hypothetical protein
MRRQWEAQVKSDPDLYTGKAGDSSLIRVADSKATGRPVASPDQVSPVGQSVAKSLPKPREMLAPIRQYSASRNQTRISYDGGKTWRIE